MLRLRGSNRSIASESSANSGYQLPNYELKNQRRKENRRKRAVITGKSDLGGCQIKGAPEPDRDLFISRLDKQTSDRDLKNFISDNGFTVRNLQRISHVDASYKSYRLTVPKSQFADLFKEEIWPSGVCVRKYVIPRRDNESKET